MATLTGTVRWVAYVPDLLGNRDLETPFYVELNGSMSKEQMKALDAALTKPAPALEPLPNDATEEQQKEHTEVMRAEIVERYAGALSSFVRFGAEPLNVDGKSIATVRDYLDFVSSSLVGWDAFMELATVLGNANRLSGQSPFFFGRLSGGFSSTTNRRNGKVGGQTVAR